MPPKVLEPVFEISGRPVAQNQPNSDWATQTLTWVAQLDDPIARGRQEL